MEAKVSVYGDVAVIHLSGRVDYDSQETFRSACLKSLAGTEQKIIFDLSHLSFVGSNAITPFVKTLEDLGQSVKGIRMYGVGSEFKKIFGASSIQRLEIFADRHGALQSFSFLPSE